MVSRKTCKLSSLSLTHSLFHSLTHTPMQAERLNKTAPGKGRRRPGGGRATSDIDTSRARSQVWGSCTTQKGEAGWGGAQCSRRPGLMKQSWNRRRKSRTHSSASVVFLSDAMVAGRWKREKGQSFLVTDTVRECSQITGGNATGSSKRRLNDTSI